jgi:hypothetical protein
MMLDQGGKMAVQRAVGEKTCFTEKAVANGLSIDKNQCSGMVFSSTMLAAAIRTWGLFLYGELGQA